MGDTSSLLLQTPSIAHALSQHKGCSFGTVRWGMFCLPCLRTRRWMDPRKESLNSLRFWLCQKHNEIKAVNLDFGKAFNFFSCPDIEWALCCWQLLIPFHSSCWNKSSTDLPDRCFNHLNFLGHINSCCYQDNLKSTSKRNYGSSAHHQPSRSSAPPPFERKQNSLENRL